MEKIVENNPHNDNYDEENVPMKSLIIDEILTWSKMIFFVLLVAVIINQFVIVNAAVPTGSMENVIMPNDRIIAFRMAYLFSEPERFDIIIFPFPDDESRLYVKRIIGLPGETVTIVNGLVFIDDNATPLRDDFIRDIATGNYGPFHVPEDSFFMLGDNRNNSDDSRAWNNPFVRSDRILGRAIFKYFRGFALLR
ncbi:MAG: signal peptidase I [Defluviitaleaceae bacterium]|nr:signal peptidase I [Defluviitaleaceae bacterium]